MGERRVHRLLHLRPESLQRLEAARRQLEAQVGAPEEIVPLMIHFVTVDGLGFSGFSCLLLYWVT